MQKMYTYIGVCLPEAAHRELTHESVYEEFVYYLSVPKLRLTDIEDSSHDA